MKPNKNNANKNNKITNAIKNNEQTYNIQN